MKTVKGEILSTTPIPISKAASILSKFVCAADTGASQAVCAYLRRAAVSFSELNQLHKELKSHRKHKTLENRIKIEEEDVDVGMDNGRKKLKKKRETGEYQDGDLKENGSKIVINKEEMKKKKKKKKRMSEEIEEERESYSEESLHKKKKKKRKNEGES